MHPRRSPSSRRCPTLAAASLALLLALPAGARAQAVTGFGDDATIAPRLGARLSITNEWLRFDQRYTAPDGASIATRSQVRTTPVRLEIGLLSRVSVSVLVPSVGTKVLATYFPDSTGSVHADSLVTYDRSGVGDVDVSAKLVWLRTISDSARFAPSGFHVRSALQGTYRLGTGSPARPTQQFGIGTGTGARAVEVASQWDLIFGRLLWASVVGRWGHRTPDFQPVRVAPPGDPFAAADTTTARRALGNYYQVEVTPRLVLGDYVSFGAQYAYYHKAADQYTAAAGSALDPSILDARSEAREQRLSLGVVYSTVAAHAHGEARWPFEISLRHTKVLSTINGAPKWNEWAVGVRAWIGRQ